MADDILVTPGLGATLAADDVGGKLHVRQKVSLGADGTAADLEAGVQPVTKSVPTVSSANASAKPTATSVGTSATQIPASPLANRRGVLVQNLGSVSIFVGDSTVTTANGIRILAGGNLPFNIGVGVLLFAIAASGTCDVRTLEFA